MRPAKRIPEAPQAERSLGIHAVRPSSSVGQRRWRKPLAIVALVALALLVVAVAVLSAKWPFTPKHIVADLEQASRTTVAFKTFHQTYFPHPGCVLEDVTFRNAGSSAPPLLAVKRLTIEGSYSGLLSGHVPVIRAEAAHVVLPPVSSGQTIFEGRSSNSHATIGEIVADGAILDVTSAHPGRPPLRFQIRKLAIHDLGAGGVLPFHLEALNPTPPGELIATGRLGPWQVANAASTQISGTYVFRKAQLGVFHGIAGILSSEGRFQGPINALSVRGSTDVPDFEVTRTGHKVHLVTQFDALVNGTQGDVLLRSINGHWGHTTVLGSGSIEGKPGRKGKTASLDFVVRNGRIDDVLYLFVRSPQAPLAGPTTFEAKVTIPPGKKKFVEKVVLDGQFEIPSARFTSSKTQNSVDKLSRQARGQKEVENPEAVVSDLNGHVLLTGGVAHFSSLVVDVPGARARMHGTYGLENQRVNLHGMLFLDAKLSQATSGIKSLLLKPIEPFLKKNRRGGAKMPVGISGTYSHPSYQTDPI